MGYDMEYDVMRFMLANKGQGGDQFEPNLIKFFKPYTTEERSVNAARAVMQRSAGLGPIKMALVISNAIYSTDKGVADANMS